MHPATIYTSEEHYLKDHVGDDCKKDSRNYRHWKRRWNLWKARHPGAPMVEKCPLCSGKAIKTDIKRGLWKPSRKTKGERDEELERE